MALVVALAASTTLAWGADVFYTGERGETTLFTNIPHGDGMVPMPGFGDGAGALKRRSATLRTRAFDDLIEGTARQYGIHPGLVRAVIQVESAFDPGAVSRKGARGLMQLMPLTARRYDVRNLFDPVENIRAGVQHLAYLAEVYGEDLDRILAAYNAGENAVRKYGGVPDYKETRRYVRKVKKLYWGPIRLENALPEKPGFFTYEDQAGVLHISDVPLASFGGPPD